MTETTAFEEQLRDRIKVKNMPNHEFTPGTFSFVDYFDLDTVEDTDNIEGLVEHVFEPYKTYFDGIEEIDYTREDEPNMNWFHVTVAIPDTRARQRLLANVVADAWEQRTNR